MVETVEEGVAWIERTFWRYHDNNPKLRRALRGKDRVILLDILDDRSYHVVVEDGRIEDVREGNVEDPDVHVRAKARDFLALLNGEMHPLTAYMTGRVKVDGPMRDLLLVKSFL